MTHAHICLKAECKNAFPCSIWQRSLLSFLPFVWWCLLFGRCRFRNYPKMPKNAQSCTLCGNISTPQPPSPGVSHCPTRQLQAHSCSTQKSFLRNQEDNTFFSCGHRVHATTAYRAQTDIFVVNYSLQQLTCNCTTEGLNSRKSKLCMLLGYDILLLIVQKSQGRAAFLQHNFRLHNGSRAHLSGSTRCCTHSYLYCSLTNFCDTCGTSLHCGRFS